MSDDTVVKQFPFDLKAEATRDGFRVSGHVYGENMDQCVTDLANMISKELTELEIHNLVLAVNQRNDVVEPIKKSFTKHYTVPEKKAKELNELVTNKGVNMEELGRRLNDIDKDKKK